MGEGQLSPMVTGAAALALLNDDADAWQAAELRGDYLTAIDYIDANLVHWESSPSALATKIEAAAHAYKWRSRLAKVSANLVIIVGVALGEAMKVLAKVGGEDGIRTGVLLAVGGGTTTYLVNALLKPAFVVRHGERAKKWKQTLDKLRRALEKARTVGNER